MRTTLTLDDDVATRLKELAARRKASFKQTVNEVLRRGLSVQQVRSPERCYRATTFNSAFRAGVDPLRLNQLNDELEAQLSNKRGTQRAAEPPKPYGK